MAIAPGYEYDLFVSYAQADNVDTHDGDGWVAQLVGHLEAVLRQRLGRSDTLAIFFDRRAAGANYQLADLLKAVERSALFLAIGSPSYIARDWPRQEFQTFLERTPDPSRLFLVECLPLSDGETYPRPLDSYARLAFWKMAGTRHIPLPCSPTVDAAEFQPLIHSLAADIRAKLLSVKVLAAPTRPEGRGVLADARKVVLIAQATDDLETEADQLRRYLQQYENEIEVLPRACYPQGGDAFRIAFGNDLAHAALFVQLLGPRAGRVPPDLCEGYTRYQCETTKASGIEMLQWRHPELDLASVTDPTHAAMLSAETVIACGLETFK
jgi:hypothetical protein